MTAGANVNSATPHGTTTLMNAVASGSLQTIGALVKGGADVRNTGRSSLSPSSNPDW